MLKKINIILIAFLLVLGVRCELAYFLYLPVYLIYILRDEKNMYYLTISSIVSLLIFSKKEIIIYLVIVICTTAFFYLLKILTNKKYLNNLFLHISIFAFITLVNLCYVYLYSKSETKVLFFIVMSLISYLVYLYLSGFVIRVLKGNKQVTEKLLFSESMLSNYYVWFELLVCVLTVLVSILQNDAYFLYVAILYASYLSMYFSRKYKNIYGLLYGLISVIILYLFSKNYLVFLVIFTSGIYITNSIYTFGIYNATLALLSINSEFILLYASLMLVSIAFEIVCKFILNIYDTNDFDIKNGIIKNTNKEILQFASFLDQFVLRFKQSVSLNEKINQGMNIIINNHCNKCDKKEECFAKNNKNLYTKFKNVLTRDNENELDNDFEYYCRDYASLLNTSKLINYQINFDNPNENKKDANNYILLNQINGVSMALKNYVIDKVSNQEIDYSLFEKTKVYLNNFDCIVTYYEVKRNYVNDFLIFIGIKNKNFMEVRSILESLFEEMLGQRVSVILVKEENSCIYVNVIPRILIDVTYAYGAIPSNDEAISGDNFLIKESENGHMIVAISDGMGKGYSAFYESDMTIHLIEEITKLNIDSSTALSILNSFYNVQDYLDRYATLDFLDINRYNQKAVFYKMGATSTYIFKKDNNVEKIINKSLPLGLDEEIDQKEVIVEDGDIIIMSSDGIIENLVDSQSFEDFIFNSKNLKPQQLVHEIFNYVLAGNLKTKDDMTLIVVKIQEKKLLNE